MAKSTTIKKVVIWRAISVSLTYLLTYLMTGDIKEATGFTLLLHLVLMIANYIYEILWEKHVSEIN
jgi:uncharacterized membrane protein